MRAFIFAAGLGTRLKTYTSDRPKALVKVAGKPMIQHVIEKLKNEGIREIIINIHHFGEQIIQFLEANNNFSCQITISDEREELLDTGGGLKKVLTLLNEGEDLLVINVDIFTDFQLMNLIKFHKENKPLVSLLVQKRNTSRYLLLNSENQLKGWTNEKTGEVIPSNIKPEHWKKFAFNGIHIVNQKTLEFFPDEKTFPLIPVYLNIAQYKKIIGLEMSNINWLDLGKAEQLKEAENIMMNSKL